MKPTTAEITNAAFQYLESLTSEEGVPRHAVDDFTEGVSWAISQMQPEWVAITNKIDLPKEPCKAFFFDKPSQTVICGSFSPTKDEINFILANASHYMIIQEPQPPTK